MPFFFKNITTKQIAQQALDATKQTGSMLRRQNMQKRIDFFDDKQDAHLLQALYDQFEYPERLKLQREFFNVTNLMVKELAVLYNENPLRELKDGNEADELLFNEILEYTDFNNTLQTVNEYVKLMRTVLVQPVWTGEMVNYRIFTPNMFDVIMDEQNPRKAKAVIYSRNYPDPSNQYYDNDDRNYRKDPFYEADTVYHVWTDDQYFMFTYQLTKDGKPLIQLIDNPNNPDNVNPYGTLDIFVPFRDGVPIDNFFLEGGDDLITTNESINIKLTELNHLIKMQSFSIPVRKGGQDNTPIILDPSMTVDLPADDDMGKSSFEFKSPDAKIVEVQTEIEQKLRRLALKYKMNPDMFNASGNKSSSQALQLQNYAQGRLIKTDKPYFRRAEKQLFNMTKLVNNTHNQRKFSDSVSLFIDFRDSEMPMTQQEKDQHNLLMYNNGLMTKSEWLLDDNPDIQTIEDAEEKLEMVNEEKTKDAEENAKRMMLMTPELNQTQQKVNDDE